MSAPLTADQLAALQAFSTPTVCNAIETFNLRPRTEGFMDHTIVCRFPELPPLVGYAVTAKIRAGSPPTDEVPFDEAWDIFAKVPRPWVIVIEDLDYPNPIGSFWGEVNGSVYKALGAAGVITNGGVRDLPEVLPTGFHFFSSCVLVSHAYVHLTEAGAPVTAGGLTVHPSDLLHADQHGVTSVPMEIADRLPAACAAIEAAERRLIDHARSGDATAETLREMYPEVD